MSAVIAAIALRVTTRRRIGIERCGGRRQLVEEGDYRIRESAAITDGCVGSSHIDVDDLTTGGRHDLMNRDVNGPTDELDGGGPRDSISH